MKIRRFQSVSRYKSCTLEKYSKNNGSIPVKNREIAKLINL